MPGPRTLVMAFVVATILATGASSYAGERYRRDWSDHPGMPRQIWDITHDDRGFLWIASEEGIHRFDGQEVVPWGQGVVRTAVHGINRGPSGQIVAYTWEGGLAYEVTASGLEVVSGPDGVPFAALLDVDYAPDGGLWLCDESGLFRRGPGGDWAKIESPELEGQLTARVRGAPDGDVYVGTRQGSFVLVHADHTAETLWAGPGGRVTRIAVKDEHTQAFTVRFGPAKGVYLVEDGAVRLVYSNVKVERRWTGLVFRNETLWVVDTAQILAISDAGRRVEVLGPAEGFHTGGTAVVDHEKSLWLTSFRGIYQFTEPDVVLSTEMDGTRRVHRVDSEIVVARWHGPFRQDKNGEWQPLTPDGLDILDWGGVSPWGAAWFVGVENRFAPQQRRFVLLERRRDGWVRHLTRDSGISSAEYAIDESGVFWIAFHDTLWRVDMEGAAPEPVARLPHGIPEIYGMAVQTDRVMMSHRYGPYCEGILDTDRRALEGEWVCETIEGAGELLELELVEGVPWIATRDRGVVRRHGDAWETIVGEKELGTSAIRGISVSPRGGVWVISFIGRVRVELEGNGVRVVERLGPWIGVPDWMMFNALEEADGTIWLAGMTSAIRIPAHARQRPIEPPQVFVTGFSADGRDLSPDSPQRLPATTRRIELSWAAPAFRDPASLRYEIRADSTGDWVPTRQRSFRFVGLGSGNYRIEVRASLDGETWTEAAADVRFAIRSPLWQRPAFWAAMLAIAAIVTLVLQWIRTRQQVRLERQRTGIAMNLHDELGAGLGSIGLLTDLAAGDDMEPQESREVATRVGEISRDLSRSLSDIVWTLRPGSVDLPGFALFLRQRASDLLSAGDTTVEFEFPEPVPAIRVELAVRRQIHAIASEALHNAAKHAQASKVRVSLRRDGDAWILRIIDDGIGFGEKPGHDGLGLESMRKRADLIGASLSIHAETNGGCRLELRFLPRAEDST
jgi:signal transduction histidine kinase/ligand-binding sensor domain-containing protein